MSDAQDHSQPAPAKSSDNSTVTLVYVLYLVAIAVGITGIVGVIIAYVKQGSADAVGANHYRFQIRTFWIGFLYSLIGALLTIILIGYLIIFFVLIWLVVRCVKGLQAINRNEPVPNVTTWMF